MKATVATAFLLASSGLHLFRQKQLFWSHILLVYIKPLIMAYMSFVTLVLLSSSSLVAPLCFGWFDEDDDDQVPVIDNGTLANITTTVMPLFNCQALDDVFSYFNDFYEYLDQTFNPFYESPSPTSVTPVLNTTELNSTSTTAAPAKKDAES